MADTIKKVDPFSSDFIAGVAYTLSIGVQMYIDPVNLRDILRELEGADLSLDQMADGGADPYDIEQIRAALEGRSPADV